MSLRPEPAARHPPSAVETTCVSLEHHTRPKSRSKYLPRKPAHKSPCLPNQTGGLHAFSNKTYHLTTKALPTSPTKHPPLYFINPHRTLIRPLLYRIPDLWGTQQRGPLPTSQITLVVQSRSRIYPHQPPKKNTARYPHSRMHTYMCTRSHTHTKPRK